MVNRMEKLRLEIYEMVKRLVNARTSYNGDDLQGKELEFY